MTTTQGEHAQTEALRLADDLEASSLFPGNMRSCNNAAAAELRRLHAQVAALTAAQEMPTCEFLAHGCDTPSYCQSVQRCTARDKTRAATAQPAAPQGVAKVNWWEADGDKYDDSITRAHPTPTAQADSVTAPAATVIKKGADRQWMSERLGHLPDGIYSLYLAPPAQAADSVLKDHQIAALVNELRDIAVEFKGTQQLRERIAQVVVPALKAQKAERVLEDAGKENICIDCTNADSWGLPDKVFCRTCVSGSHWEPLNRDSVNPNKAAPQPTPTAQAAPAAGAVAGPSVRKVFLVATGAEHEGEATYTRYDDAPPPLCDSECLYTAAPTPAAQADSQPAPAPQGETNVQLDIDSNPSTPGQHRDMAGSVALGQPMGNGQDQAAGHLGAQGDKLLTVAERNIRSFLRSAVFKSESDREAALSCVDVLCDAARAPADSVTAPVRQGKWTWVPVEPSTAMLVAGNHGQPGDFSALKVWEDMLGALDRSFDYTRPVDPPSTTPPAQAPHAGRQQEARPCHVFTVRKAGALTEWEPTSMAFALPDGAHALYTLPQPTPAAQAQAGAVPLTAKQMESGREAIFSTGNPYCPCDSKTFRKVAEWVERHHGIRGADHG